MVAMLMLMSYLASGNQYVLMFVASALTGF